MKIVILDDYQNVALSLADWDCLGAEVEVLTEHVAGTDELVRRLAGAEVVVAMRERTPLPAEVLTRLPELGLIVSTGGPRNPSIDLATARERGVVVSHTGYLPHPAAEMTWALILAAQRHIPTEDRAMRAGHWQSTIGEPLQDRTLGLLGLGRLGGRVARVARAFGMRTIAWSQNLTADRAAEHDTEAVSKEELFATADVVSVHLVLSRRTRGLVGAGELRAMKPGALLVNTSRGPLVDEGALVDILRDGHIRAALDVYDTEPLPADHVLRSLPNVTLAPHVGYVTADQYGTFFRDAVADIAAWQAGEPVRVMPVP